MLALDDNDLQVEIAKRLVGAEEVRERIDSLLAHRTFDKSSVIYQKKSRVKTAQSIYEKIQDRRITRPERGYGLGDIGDVIGFRLITLYDDSLYDLFKELMAVIEQGISIANPIFKKVSAADGALSLPHTFNDCCVFAQHGGETNPYMMCLAAIQKGFGLKDDALVRREIRENGYSSIHIQLDGILYRGGHKQPIPVEFQLRTALEDTWAEISHELEYKKRYDRLGEKFDWKTSISIASQHLQMFKKTIDLATEQARELRISYKKIDGQIAPTLLNRQFIIERPISLMLIEERYAVPFTGDGAQAADDLHVLLNRLARLRNEVEKEGKPRDPNPEIAPAPLKPKFEQDPRWRDAERAIKELEDYFDHNVADRAARAAIKSLLDLERALFAIRVLTCRVAQKKYEKKPPDQYQPELAALRKQLAEVKQSVKNKDATFQFIGAAVSALAARNMDDEALKLQSASRAFEIAEKNIKGANAAEIVMVAQTTLCINALVVHLTRNVQEAARLRKDAMAAKSASRSKFIKLTLKNLRDALLILTKFHDPKCDYKLYADNIISVGNNALSFVVDLHDAGVDDKEITALISSQQISNITEMMGKHDVEPEFRGYRLHTLCGVYRILKRPEQRKRAARELREQMDSEAKTRRGLNALVKAAYEEELARA